MQNMYENKYYVIPAAIISANDSSSNSSFNLLSLYMNRFCMFITYTLDSYVSTAEAI
jgi:hypothetical protein